MRDFGQVCQACPVRLNADITRAETFSSCSGNEISQTTDDSNSQYSLNLGQIEQSRLPDENEGEATQRHIDGCNGPRSSKRPLLPFRRAKIICGIALGEQPDTAQPNRLEASPDVSGLQEVYDALKEIPLTTDEIYPHIAIPDFITRVKAVTTRSLSGSIGTIASEREVFLEKSSWQSDSDENLKHLYRVHFVKGPRFIFQQEGPFIDKRDCATTLALGIRTYLDADETALRASDQIHDIIIQSIKAERAERIAHFEAQRQF